MKARGRRVAAASFVVTSLIVVAVLVVGPGAGGQTPVDHDKAAAEEFSNGKPCPAGEPVNVAEWEDQVARMEEISDKYGLEESPPVMVDQVSVRLAELPTDRPKGLDGPVVGAVALCVETNDGLMDTGALSWLVDVPVEEEDR